MFRGKYESKDFLVWSQENVCLSGVTCLNADFSPLSTQRLEVNIRAKTSWYGVRKMCV